MHRYFWIETRITMKLFLILSKFYFYGLVKTIPDIQDHHQTTSLSIYLFNINNKGTRMYMDAVLVYL